MKYPKHAKRKLFTSFLCILLCISMLLGSTYAWFTDRVSTKNNIITSGNLDLEMYWTDDPSTGVWNNVEEDAFNTIFSYDNWEPGYTDVKYIKLVNKGNLALNYDLSIEAQGAVGKLAEVINVYFAVNEDKLNLRSDLDRLSCIGLLSNVMNGGSQASGTLLPEGTTSLFHNSGEVIVTLAMQMITTAGNEYQNESSGEFTIKALATQAPWESDSFGSDYDSAAEMPVVLVATNITVPVTAENNAIPAGGLEIVGTHAAAYLPEGVKLEPGVTELTFSITPKDASTSGLSAVNDESILPMDVHIEGVAEDNTVPIIIDLGVVLPKHLNLGNYYLVHVEDGNTNVMTQVSSRDQLQNHNEFTYDSATGAVSVAMASFSAVEAIANNANEWKGGVDYEWFTVWAHNDSGNLNRRTYTLTNADQLYGFAKILGGMHTQDEEWLALKNEGKLTDNVFTDGSGNDILDIGFNGHTVQLLNDVDLGGTEVKDVSGKKVVFYPIGYYNSTRTGTDDKGNPTNIVYDREDGDVTNLTITSSFEAFRGTFNGNGHTIRNLYQNTWEMFGDYNSGYSGNPNYYKDGMGLFGWLYGATIYNTNVDNFQSDGEFTPTGIIAAYAEAAHDQESNDFGETTISGVNITNSNPRVYNTGNGGIVGIGGRSNTPSAFGTCNTCTLKFTNITVDQSNKISALWGSWDVGCGGIMGMYRGYGQVEFNNCHVAAQIDVYNDVCGNYQYYWYRYAGMMIGTIYNSKVDENGYTVPDTTGITATNCTVRFDEWNDYYYCELVANSLASYTHDHQMSRLTEVQSVDVENKTYVDLKGVQHNIPNSGRYNYVVTEPGERSTEKATCYHFVDGAVWNHADAGYDVGIDEDKDGKDDLKEDKQHIYLPFNQLFQGYGWGVKNIPIYDDGTGFPGITIQTRADFAEQKFTANFATSSTAPLQVGTGATIKVGDLFTAVDPNNVLSSTAVFVEEIQNDGTYKRIAQNSGKNWGANTFTVSETAGTVYQISIQDFNYCLPTVMYLQVAADRAASTCEHCNQSVTWKAWYPGALPNGHYYLTGDVTLANPVTVATNAEAVLDLSGHTLSAPKGAAVDVGEKQTLAIVDSTNTGKITGLGDEDGLLKACGGTLKLYDGEISGGDDTTNKGLIWAANLVKDENTAGVQTTVLFNQNVTVAGQIFLAAGAQMKVVGQFDTDNVAKVVLENEAIMIIEDMTAPESDKKITVEAIGSFAKMLTGNNEQDPMTARKAWFIPAQGTITAGGQRELMIEVDISEQIQLAVQKGKTIAQIQQSATTMQEWIDAKKCPMCDKTNITWEEYDRAKHGLVSGSVSKHIYFKNGTTYGTKNTPIGSGNFIGSYAGTKTTCVMVMDTNVYTSGRFLVNPGNTLNIMGKGNIHGTNNFGLGLFTVLGKNATVNIYGGNFTYSGDYRRNEPTNEPTYALIYTSAKGCTVNIFNDVKIGYNEKQQSPNYNAFISGTLNMYGGTIQNGVSDYEGIGGNVTVDASGVLNMYNGTITGGSTNYRGGNVLLRSFSTLNMGYKKTVEGVTMNPQITGGTALYEQNTYDNAGKTNIVPGGGNIGTGMFVGYININMYSGQISGGTVNEGDATLYKEYMGGGNIYMNGGAYNKINLHSGTVTGGKAYVGGNIYIRNGVVCTIEKNVAISNGTATIYGGNIHVFNRANLNVNDATITGGKAKVGGNISVGQGTETEQAPTATIQNATISGGSATENGGNIYANKSVVTITNCEITNGSSAVSGGNVMAYNANMTITNCEITDGNAKYGGNFAGSECIGENKAITISGSTISGGSATENGGNIYVRDVDMTISDCSITGGTAKTGGNIAIATSTMDGAEVKIVNSTVSDGVASANGGNILANGVKLTITNSNIIDGNVTENGGYAEYGGNIFVLNGTVLNITGGTISGGLSDRGGNIYVGDATGAQVTANINGTTIMNGHARAFGGNIFLQNGVLTIKDGLMYGGTADSTSEPRQQGSNICVMGTALTNGQAPQLILDSAKINGNIEVFRYDETNKPGLTPVLILKGATQILKELTVDGNTYTATTQYGTPTGLMVGTGVTMDISGLTSGAKIDLQMRTVPSVFTSNRGSITAATAQTYFTVLNSGYVIVEDNGQLALRK